MDNITGSIVAKDYSTIINSDIKNSYKYKYFSSGFITGIVSSIIANIVWQYKYIIIEQLISIFGTK